ncbi:MAG: glutathione synthase [Gammaproteobacteria bacterium]
MTVAVVMDPIAAIKPWKDTTLAMMIEAQRRGARLLYIELANLYLVDGVCRANAREITVTDSREAWYAFGKSSDGALHELADIVLMRKDPPFDTEYVYATYLLERAELAGAQIVNAPAALRDVNEKAFISWFPQCCAPTLITRDIPRLRAFVAEHGDTVMKPLSGMGGASIFRVTPGDPNTSVIAETLTDNGTRFVMAQRYIPEIAAGDKRILLVGGLPVPYALARIPAAGESRGNLAAGGRGVGIPLSDRDRWICAQVGATLRDKGLMFVGLDVIGDYLTEINVTSPTCVRELDEAFGLNIAGMLFDTLDERRG